VPCREAAEPGPDPLLGQSVGGYRLIGRLGAGGMGTVYRAEGPGGEPVALKTLPVPRAETLLRIRREIHALSRIRHPGIVRILDSGTLEGVPWYAMELVEGEPLRRWCGEEGLGVPLEPRLALVRGLCLALAYLHGEGLVHRDLKPENILVPGRRQEAADNRGRGPAAHRLWPTASPVIVDFGLAAEFGGPLSREALHPEAGSAGTPLYMAPEQIRGELLDARADLYALGCILYELITGRPPFATRDAREAIEAHLHKAPAQPSTLVSGLPQELDALVLRLLAKSLQQRIGHADDVAAALARLGAGGASAEAAPRPRPYLYRPGFFGRREAMRELLQELVLPGRAGPRIVLIGGESGVGKTRLVLEAAREAERRGLRILSGECLPGQVGSEDRLAGGLAPLPSPDSRLSSSSGSARAPRVRSDRSPLPSAAGGPLQALRQPLQAVADRCREQGPAETQRLVGRRASVLAAYEPGLASLPGQETVQPPAELPATEARRRLFAALTETFAALAQEQPVLLVLDDLQWADELTLGWLQDLAPAGSGGTKAPGSVLVLGTYRTEEAEAPGGEMLRRLLGSAQVHRLHLARLEPAAVGSMVGDMLALDPAPESLVSTLTRHSEGNPFFVAEYLRAAVQEGMLVRDQQGRWQVRTDSPVQELALPRSLHELVSRRMQDLQPEARALVEAMAVLGRQAEPPLAAEVARLGEAELHEAVNELLRRQVLETPALRELRFVHDKLREVAYGVIPPQRRVELHGAAAEAIEARFSSEKDQHLEELGRHWERAAAVEKARPCYRAAARLATARYALVEAERLYRAFLALVPEPTLESVEARGMLGYEVLYLQGRTAEAIDECQAAVEEASALGDRAAEGHLRLWLGMIYWREGHLEQARALSEQALATARQVGARKLEGTSLTILANILHHLGEPARLPAIYNQALGIVREVGDRENEGVILGNLAECLFEQGDLKRSVELSEEALAIACAAGDRRREGLVLGTLAEVHFALGALEQAERLINQAILIHREVTDRRLEARRLLNLARLKRLKAGASNEIEALLDQGEQIVEQLKDRLGSLRSLCERGHAALARGRTAKPFLKRARRLAAELKVGPESPFGKAIQHLQRACESCEAGESHRLFRGERIEDLPEGLRRWLAETGQLP
jgi:tetratricopeptide (TPR) repeat protein